MKVLVIGGGGREHAICWKLAQSRHMPEIFCAPGNAGTAMHGRNVPIAANDVAGLRAFAQQEAIDLTIVGPEDPLCLGIVDEFTAAGLRIFGPNKAAARIEGDKVWAKKLMREAGVPTAEARIFEPTAQELVQLRQAHRGDDFEMPESVETGYKMALRYVSTRDEGVVVKAAGLAKGKGVFVHDDPADALLTLEKLMVHRELGDAGTRIVVEEILIGREVSILALVDGSTIYVLESAADHKRLGEQDTGPNTGGMGAFSPSGLLTEKDLEIIEREVFVPIIDAMRRMEIEYRGVLYAGMMMTAGGPKVLEFNCRLGDPEAQPLLMRLKSDLVDVINAVIDGTLEDIKLEWDRRSSLCVVMASGGYPGAYEKGKEITGLDDAAAVENAVVFHAGTRRVGDRVETSGGRVLGVTALGGDLQKARTTAYEAVRKIAFDGAVLRGDIGMRVSGR
ncbi:MAG: phosphoribosylamine--glycine ligase [Phycisphaerales bacterium]|nr:phosphoribosylamine--glycine ligase [Phycisphaerales bacterium]MCB9858609.1 phosphoribosylamine--glycine ligase [Phycisphaerales bacterium]